MSTFWAVAEFLAGFFLIPIPISLGGGILFMSLGASVATSQTLVAVVLAAIGVGLFFIRKALAFGVLASAAWDILAIVAGSLLS